MFWAIFVWLIGWFFTMGVAWEDEFVGHEISSNVVDVLIALVLWPILLGQEFNKRFPRVQKTAFIDLR